MFSLVATCDILVSPSLTVVTGLDVELAQGSETGEKVVSILGGMYLISFLDILAILAYRADYGVVGCLPELATKFLRNL